MNAYHLSFKTSGLTKGNVPMHSFVNATKINIMKVFNGMAFHNHICSPISGQYDCLFIDSVKLNSGLRFTTMTHAYVSKHKLEQGAMFKTNNTGSVFCMVSG